MQPSESVSARFAATSAALVGLSRAVERYRAATANESPEPQDVFVSLSEALFWATAANEIFEKVAGGAYKAARDADSDGVFCRGLKYARNRCTHQLALIVDQRALTFPLRFPITFEVLFRWRPSAELPTPDPRYKDEDGKAAYDALLAGSPAAEALDRAVRWLATASRTFSGLPFDNR